MAGNYYVTLGKSLHGSVLFVHVHTPTPLVFKFFCKAMSHQQWNEDLAIPYFYNNEYLIKLNE